MKVLREIINSMPASKSRYDLYANPAAYFIARPCSYLVTWILVKLGVSANATSALSIVVVLASFTAALVGNFIAVIVLVWLWLILDCADGNIARFRGTGSRQGEFLDAVGGYLLTAGIYLCIGYGNGNELHVLVGGLASVFTILSRLLLNKFNVLSGSSRSASGDVGAGFAGSLVLSFYNLSGVGLLVFTLLLLFELAFELLLFQAVVGLVVTLAVFRKSYVGLSGAK